MECCSNTSQDKGRYLSDGVLRYISYIRSVPQHWNEKYELGLIETGMGIGKRSTAMTQRRVQS